MDQSLTSLPARFRAVAPACDYWTLRLVASRDERLAVRQGVPEPLARSQGLGVMVCVEAGGGSGYAATSDLGAAGLRQAGARARDWALAAARLALPGTTALPRLAASGRYASPVADPWDGVPVADKLAWLAATAPRLRAGERIVDWLAALYHRQQQVLLADADGQRLEQEFSWIAPTLRAVAFDGDKAEARTVGGANAVRQGGLEQLASLGFPDRAEQVGEEALALLAAPPCPSGRMPLLLTPSQMVLQIHESIGHPLELDRILGDERNYAGTSFVTPDMFGSYRYGSELLDVTFDPGRPEQAVSYAWDDAGTPAARVHLIEKGILQRPLGGTLSQRRSGLPGTANARAVDWNRPPIDRMANLNVEPGTTPFAELVKGIERGVLMDTNRSWSIDDSRNKFQFGCEFGRVIRDGELGEVVRDCNYRGLSAEFWRNLAAVGDAASFEVLGVLNCGKGEPNQAVFVGHAAPACVFREVDVFSEVG
ncbi:MAG TPA: TldD/PmbA family protein [Gammaproteobacteria bacterium]